MTKKEIYNLSLQISRLVLNTWNGGNGFEAGYFKNRMGQAIVKVVYSVLEPILVQSPISEDPYGHNAAFADASKTFQKE